MPKQRSTRGAPVKRKASRRTAAIGSGGGNPDGIPLTKEDISKYTDSARKLVLGAWPEIVRGLIKKAAEGGYQQAKLLLDVCNLIEPDGSPFEEKRKRQLCDALMEGLELSSVKPEPELEVTEGTQPVRVFPALNEI